MLSEASRTTPSRWAAGTAEPPRGGALVVRTSPRRSSSPRRAVRAPGVVLRPRRSAGHPVVVLRRSLDIEPLDVDGWLDETLRDVQEEGGAVFEDGAGVPSRFEATEGMSAEDVRSGSSCVFCDQSDRAVLQVSGSDRLAFLHNQSTASVEGSETGDVVETAFVTAKAGIIDVATLLIQRESVLVLASPGNARALSDHLEKHVFPRDDVVVSDISSDLAIFSVLGGESDQVLRRLGMGQKIGPKEQVLMNFQGYPLCVASGGLASIPGYTWVVDANASVEAWRVLEGMDGVYPVGSDLRDALRIGEGVPAVGKEIAIGETNPLEAGLFALVDVDKGCSIGQEVIKRIHSRNGITRRLWGLASENEIREGEVISLPDGRKVGTVTSARQCAGGDFLGMGYTKVKVNRETFSADGESLVVGGTEVKGRALAYPKYPEAEPEEEEDDQESLEEEEAKAQKKREMEARMQDWLKANQQPKK